MNAQPDGEAWPVDDLAEVAGPDEPAEPAGPDDLEPAEAEPAGLPPVPGTGDERVDAAVAELDRLVGQPPAAHVEIYEDVHRRLQDTLADLDGG